MLELIGWVLVIAAILFLCRTIRVLWREVETLRAQVESMGKSTGRPDLLKPAIRRTMWD